MCIHDTVVIHAQPYNICIHSKTLVTKSNGRTDMYLRALLIIYVTCTIKSAPFLRVSHDVYIQQTTIQTADYTTTSQNNTTSQIVVHDELYYVYIMYLSVMHDKIRSTQHTPK